MAKFRQKTMMLDGLMPQGWGDTPDHFRDREKLYGTAKMKVLAVFMAQTDMTAATPSLTTCVEFMQTFDIIPAPS